MNPASNLQSLPQETDLLAQFEIHNIPVQYREYYAAKRNNFFASIQSFPLIWKCYLVLDAIFLHEFEDLKSARDPERMFPLLLYFNAHAKIRVGMELAFSGCMAEARSILRDSVECVAHAHTMLADSELQKIWLSKNDGRAALEAFKDAFERQKKDRMFKDLEELHKCWGQLSETGSHATINAICDRFMTIESGNIVEFRLNYCGVEPRMWATSTFSMLLTCSTMEKALFSDFSSRLNLDSGLMQLRSEFDSFKEQLRNRLIAHYELKPPVPKSPIVKP